jgi:hypothetical protein
MREGENVNEIDKRLQEAVAECNCCWPSQLESGVMFFKGLRITRDEFEAECRRAETGGNWKWA